MDAMFHTPSLEGVAALLHTKAAMGAYLVTLEGTYQNPRKAEPRMVFTQARRLSGSLPFVGGGEFAFTFPVFSQTGITVTICAADVYVTSFNAQATQLPVIHIMGDSTVSDQIAGYPYFPAGSYCGWGQMLPFFLKDVAVNNHAIGGRHTESFREEGRWARLSAQIKEDDFVMMQFGHNDGKLPHLSPQTGYRANLLRYVEEIKELGARPVIVSPISRNAWTDDTFDHSLRLYAEVSSDVADQTGTVFVDLHKSSAKWMMKAGQKDARQFFYPNDATHTNDYGGFLAARFIANSCPFFTNFVKQTLPPEKVFTNFPQNA